MYAKRCTVVSTACHRLNTFKKSARCIRWPGLALIRLSCRCVIDVMLQHCVCRTELIRTWIIVCSVSFHLLLSEFAIPKLRKQLIHSLMEWLPYTVFDTGTLDGYKGAVNRRLIPWVCFSVFPCRRCSWYCVSNLSTILFFPLGPVLLVLIIIIIVIIIIMKLCWNEHVRLFHSTFQLGCSAVHQPNNKIVLTCTNPLGHLYSSKSRHLARVAPHPVSMQWGIPNSNWGGQYTRSRVQSPDGNILLNMTRCT